MPSDLAPTSTKPITVMVMRHGGTHLILPMIKLMTGKAIYRPKGQEALICTPNGRVVIFIRNPRNRLISHYRWKRGAIPNDRELADFMATTKRDHTSTPLEFATAWAQRWMRHKGALVVRFEDLVDEVKGLREIDRMARFLNVGPDARSIFDAMIGRGTFTGRHSDWREVFGERSLRVYRDGGGDRLDKLMGYANE